MTRVFLIALWVVWFALALFGIWADPSPATEENIVATLLLTILPLASFTLYRVND